MSTIIKYTNSDSEPINIQQVSSLRFYNKQIFEDGELKKIEKYGTYKRTDDIILKGGEYYLSPGENLETIIDQYSSTAAYWDFLFNKQINEFGDIYREYVSYKNGVLDGKGRQVHNNEGLLIASCTVDINTNQLDNERKYFYGDINIYRRADYKTSYISISYENNEVRQIYVEEENYLLSEFLMSFQANVFIWNDNPYYHHFEPMLSNSPIV